MDDAPFPEKNAGSEQTSAWNEADYSVTLLKTVLPSLRDQVVVIDRRGEILAVNQEWLRLALENNIEDLEGIMPGANYFTAWKGAADNAHPEAKAALIGIQAVLKGKRKVFELEYECSSLEIKRWYRMAVTPLQAPAGGAVITHSDITRLRASEEQARQREERLAEVQRLASMAIWEWDLDSDLLTLSEEGCRILGLEQQAEMTGRALAAMIVPEDREGVRAAISHALDDPFGIYEVEHRLSAPDGSARIVRQHGRVVRDRSGKPVRIAGTCLDITKQRLAEFESRRLRAELAHRERLGIMSFMTATITHEISQPLAAILSHAQAALRFLNAEEPCFEEVREALEDIVADDKRAAEIIRRLRAMTKKGEETCEPFDLNEIIGHMILLIRSELNVRNVAIRRHFSPGLRPLCGNTIQIQQVILNLLLNALEAMKNLPAENCVLEISTAITLDNTVTAHFHDNGPGLSQETVEAIFAPLFTTKPKGSGLGLAICRFIIESHGGRLWAENHPEGGALFSFQLPLPTEITGETA